MARRIGVSTSFVTEIEKGRKAPSFATIEKIAEETHAPVWSYFCEGGSEIRDDDMTSLEVLRYRLKQSVWCALQSTRRWTRDEASIRRVKNHDGGSCAVFNLFFPITS